MLQGTALSQIVLLSLSYSQKVCILVRRSPHYDRPAGVRRDPPTLFLHSTRVCKTLNGIGTGRSTTMFFLSFV